jgi:hypothetical protein
MIIIILLLIIIFYLFQRIKKNEHFSEFSDFKKVTGYNLTNYKWNNSQNYNLENNNFDKKIKYMIDNSIFIDDNKKCPMAEMNLINNYNKVKIPLLEEKCNNNLYKYTLLNNIYFRNKINKNDYVYFKYNGGFYKIV